MGTETGHTESTKFFTPLGPQSASRRLSALSFQSGHDGVVRPKTWLAVPPSEVEVVLRIGTGAFVSAQPAIPASYQILTASIFDGTPAPGRLI